MGKSIIKTSKIAVCVPYRDREEHLKLFVPQLSSFLSDKGIEHKIFICHQADQKDFNRGMLKNIAFHVAASEGYDYFAFHDIDMLPEGDADYSFPEGGPVLLATHVEKFGYQLPTIDYFGGVLLFSKKHFAKVNGYSNRYWGWGEEDDDLFWRCRHYGLAKREALPLEMGTQKVANFNGESSFIRVMGRPRLHNLLQGSFSMTALVKTSRRDEMPVHYFSHPDSPLLETPVVSRDEVDLLPYSNTLAYSGVYTGEEGKESHELWRKRYFEQWTWITLVVDAEKKKCRFFVNGQEPGSENEECKPSPHPFNTPFVDLEETPFLIGSRYVFNEKMDYSPMDFFKGQMAQVCFWDRALKKSEVDSMLNNANWNPVQDGLLVHYDFSETAGRFIIDKSGNNLHGFAENLEIQDQPIGTVYRTAVPYRRDTRYKALKHEGEGYNHGYSFNENTYNNERYFRDEVQQGKVDFQKDGLTTLDYEVISRETIFEKHCMVNVKC